MSYLNIDSSTLPNLKQAVISLWFRIPKSSMDAAAAAWQQYQDRWGNLPPFNGVIPLVCIGPSGTLQRGSADATIVPGTRFYSPFESNPGDLITYELTGLETPVSGPWPHDLDSWYAYYYYTLSFNLNAAWGGYLLVHSSDFAVLTPINYGPQVVTEPTCIGVACQKDQQTGEVTATLYTSLQTNARATIKNGEIMATGETPWIDYAPGAITITVQHWKELRFTILSVVSETLLDSTSTVIPATGGGANSPGSVTFTDTSNFAYNSTEQFVGSGQITIVPDEWHHVLLSFDLQTVAVHGETADDLDAPTGKWVDSASHMWLAFDDVNRNGPALGDTDGNSDTQFSFSNSGQWPTGSDDPNAIITLNAAQIAGARPRELFDVQFKATGEVQATFNFPDPTIPCSGAPMGFPAYAKFVDNIYDVEHAEFQMFANMKVDTADEKIRRYFVDAKGKPVPAAQKKTADGKKGSGSIEGLGKKPDILLHGTGNWQKGKNTGSLGVDKDNKPIPSGQFTPKAYIAPYKPDPSLHGPQGAPQMVRMPVRLTRRNQEPVE